MSTPNCRIQAAPQTMTTHMKVRRGSLGKKKKRKSVQEGVGELKVNNFLKWPQDITYIMKLSK